MRRLLPLVLAIPLTACDGKPPADSPPAAAVDSMTARVDLTIGSPDDPDTEFGRVGGVTVDEAGRIFVADAINHEIRVFAPDGTLRYRIGRQGSGPGEFISPCCIAFDAGGRLYVRDGENHRYNVYSPGDTSAEYVGQLEMSHGDVNRWVTTSFDPEGRLIDIGAGSTPTGERRTLRHHIGSDGRLATVDTMPEVPEDSTAMKKVSRAVPDGAVTLFFYQPFGPEALQAFARNGDYAHGLSSRYAIDWRDSGGELRHHIVADLAKGPPLSADERARGEEMIVDAVKRSGKSRGELGFDVPATKPIVRGLHFDQRGQLWVELHVAEGEPRRAHVYDTAGKHIATVTWPRTVRSLEWIGENVAYGIGTDSLDVPFVTRLRW